MKTRALFLNCNGVINIDYGYVYLKKDFVFQAGIFDLCRQAIKNNFKIFIITNQSGIGRGYYSSEDFVKITNWMLEVFSVNNILIDDLYFCSHRPEEQCTCRKPETSMIDLAVEKYNIELETSIIIGDRQSDLDLGLRMNIGCIVGLGTRLKPTNRRVKYYSDIMCLDFDELFKINF